MKKLFFFLAFVPLLAFQCNKDNLECLKGKVIRISCASYVIQVLDNDSLGEDQWKLTRDGIEETYDNVFAASNKCKISSSYKAGDIIYFTIGAPTQSDCVVCAMYDAPPKVQYEVKNVSSSPCE